MQRVAAFLLERHDGMNWPAARDEEARRLKDLVLAWLEGKGAETAADTGDFKPQDGEGTFRIETARDTDRSWWIVRLRETTASGRVVATACSITAASDRVAVYVTIETGTVTSHVRQVSVDVRRPKFIRSMLELEGRWYHGRSTLRTLQHVESFADGTLLVSEIRNEDRTVPYLLISTRDGQQALDGMAAKLAYDLMGLANVFLLSDDAAWALSDELGSRWSCHSGAIRLFWPSFTTEDDRLTHPLWHADQLRNIPTDPSGTMQRFATELRRILFHASAISVNRPTEIDEIRDAATQQVLTALRERATSLSEYEQLAELYAAENDRLRDERSMLRSNLEDARAEIGRLSVETRSLQAAVASRDTSASDAFAPSVSIPPGEGDPMRDEVRFYKKIEAKPPYDVMKRIKDCGHNKWQPANKADKARKGIARLENGRSDWRTLFHCGRCEGGGVWMVKW